MAKATDLPGATDYSSGVKKVLILGKDGRAMASPSNPLPVDASVSVDSMTINAEMKVDSGHDLYEAANVKRTANLAVSFNSVSGLTLAKVQSVENKTKGWIYNTKGATVTNTTITLVAANQNTGYPVMAVGDEIEVIYRGASRFPSSVRADSSKTGATQVIVTQNIDSSGNVGGGSSPSTTADYKSPTDFVATYTSSTTITLTQVPVEIINDAQIKYIMMVPSSGQAKIFVNGSGGVTITHASGVLTMTGAGSPFSAGDTYEVGINGDTKAYDLGLDVIKTINQAPDSAMYSNDVIVDDTNLAAGTAYFPSADGMSMDGFRHLSLSGTLIDANNTTTLSVEVTNDPNTSTADWTPVSGFDWVSGSYKNEIKATSTTVLFALAFESLVFSNVRVKIVTGDATNTVRVMGKKMY